MPLLAKDLVSDEIPSLKVTHTGDRALRWMDEFKMTHLPVFEEERYIGLALESDILDMLSLDDNISSIKNKLVKSYVLDTQHVFEVVTIISKLKVSAIPVLDKKENFLGTIKLQKILDVIADLSLISDPGGVIVLELNINDYAVSEIARIVESDDARILGMYISAHPDSTKMEVTLKINKVNLGAILQTFERYNYVVSASYDQGNEEQNLKDRFDSFMNYLNM